jgi:hypothetical protein
MTPDLSAAAHQLLLDQRREWPTLETGYASLGTVQTRSIPFDGFEIILQFNPGRMISASAKIDPKSIGERRCFLCESNLPSQQRGNPFGEDYLILCNPFPIFPEHFTIPHRQHRPQLIADSFATMLQLSRALSSRYVVFYNGPRCGASAPDHLHFQAGTKEFLPIYRDFDRIKSQSISLAENSRLRASANIHYLGPFISLESSDSDAICQAFDVAYAALQRITSTTDEPLLNILCSYDAGSWRTLIFPRSKHRPSCYFAEGDAKILLSPATVEMSGVCALPVKHDFDRISRDDLIKVYEEVMLPSAQFQDLCNQLKSKLT